MVLGRRIGSKERCDVFASVPTVVLCPFLFSFFSSFFLFLRTPVLFHLTFLPEFLPSSSFQMILTWIARANGGKTQMARLNLPLSSMPAGPPCSTAQKRVPVACVGKPSARAISEEEGVSPDGIRASACPVRDGLS